MRQCLNTGILPAEENMALITTNQAPWMTASVLGHALVLLAFIFCLRPVMPTVKLGDADQQVISSYINDIQPSSAAPDKPLTAPFKHALALTSPSHAAAPAAITTPRATVKGAPMPELVALLHAAIQREQRYPASAQEMEREGRATLSFTLFPDGNITNLKLARSSGTNALDNAALAAVTHAAPFAQVDRYVHAAQQYDIDVVFQLN